MKKIAFFALVGFVAVAAAACGSKPAEAPDTSMTEETPAAEEEKTEEEAPAEAPSEEAPAEEKAEEAAE